MIKQTFFLEDSKLLTHVYGNGQNRIILFFGGWGTSITDTYHETLNKMGEHFRIYAFSLPGFGDNHQVDLVEANLHTIADYLAKAIESTPYFGKQKVILMGHSTGAGVATIIAERWGESQVSELILLSPIGSPDPIHKSFIRMLKYLNWKKVKDRNRYAQKGQWLRRFLIGIDAKRYSIEASVINITKQDIPIYLYVDPEDKITPPGLLPSLVLEERLYIVEGGHGWFSKEGSIVSDNMLSGQKIVDPKNHHCNKQISVRYLLKRIKQIFR